MAELKTFFLEIITPERTFYEGNAEMIELSTTEGKIGVYAEHTPTTAIIVPDILRIHEDEVKEAALHEGFIEILKDRIIIMAQSCEWPDEIDKNRAMEAKVRAERRIASGETDVNLVRAENALRKSLVRLQVADERK